MQVHRASTSSCPGSSGKADKVRETLAVDVKAGKPKFGGFHKLGCAKMEDLQWKIQ